MKGGKGQVLQLPLDLLDPEPVGQGRIDVEGLLGGAPLLPLGHDRQGAHVVQAVRELIRSTRQSLAIATSILRMVAACWASFESNWRRSSLVTPSTTRATTGPKLPSTSSRVMPVSSTASWSRAAATVVGVEARPATMAATAMGWVT